MTHSFFFTGRRMQVPIGHFILRKLPVFRGTPPVFTWLKDYGALNG